MNDQDELAEKWGPVACRIKRNLNPPSTIYSVDPDLAQRLHAIMRARGIMPTPRSHHKKKNGLGRRENMRSLMRNSAARRHKKLLEDRAAKLPKKEMEKVHIVEYQQLGYSVEKISEKYNVAKSTLALRWKELGLPISKTKEDRHWRPDDKR